MVDVLDEIFKKDELYGATELLATKVWDADIAVLVAVEPEVK